MFDFLHDFLVFQVWNNLTLREAKFIYAFFVTIEKNALKKLEIQVCLFHMLHYGPSKFEANQRLETIIK